jgi:flagellar motor switch protein FliN/FliY
MTRHGEDAATQSVQSDERAAAGDRRSPHDLEAVYDIPVLVSAVLGRATMQVSQLLKLGRGAIVELDRRVGDPIDIFVNNRLIARGEIVMIDDSRLGVTMTEIVKTDRGN